MLSKSVNNILIKNDKMNSSMNYRYIIQYIIWNCDDYNAIVIGLMSKMTWILDIQCISFKFDISHPYTVS